MDRPPPLSPAPLDSQTPTRPIAPHTPGAGTPCATCCADADACCVCFSPMMSPSAGGSRFLASGKKRFTTACGHSFHRSCIAAVRGHKRTGGCPLCRAPLQTGLTPLQARALHAAVTRLGAHAAYCIIDAQNVGGHIMATENLGAVDSVFFVDNIVNRARTARLAVINAMNHRVRPQAAQPSSLGRPARRRTLDMHSPSALEPPPSTGSGGGGVSS